MVELKELYAALGELQMRKEVAEAQLANVKQQIIQELNKGGRHEGIVGSNPNAIQQQTGRIGEPVKSNSGIEVPVKDKGAGKPKTKGTS